MFRSGVVLHEKQRADGQAKVLVSQYNSLEGNRYFDTASQTSFELDQATQVRRQILDDVALS